MSKLRRALIAVFISSLLVFPQAVPSYAWEQPNLRASQSTPKFSLTAQGWKKSPVWSGDEAGPRDQQGRPWFAVDFNDSEWSAVTLPDSGRESNKVDRYYRLRFNWDGVSIVSVNFLADDGITVRVNGERIGSWGNGWRKPGCVNQPGNCGVVVSVPDQIVLPLLVPGENVIAIDLSNGACCDYYLNVPIIGSDWIDLEALRKDYNAKIGKPEAAYAHQYLCIATKSCEEYERDKVNGWASGFIKYLFTYMATHNKGIRGSDYKCSSITFNSICLSGAGEQHIWNELIPGFTSYCTTIRNQADYVRWDADHEQFFEHAIKPCFDELTKSNEIATWIANYGKTNIPPRLRAIREYIQHIACPMISAPAPGQQIQARANECTVPTAPAPLSKEELYAPELNQGSTLSVSVTSDFFLPVGTTMQFKVTKTTGDGQVVDVTTANTGTRYTLFPVTDGVAISPDGALIVAGSLSPITSIPQLLYVVIQNGNDWGVSQFALTDQDSDGDLLVDSYERKVGLDPDTINCPNSDLDGDGLNELSEALLHTNPLQSDSDKDGSNDGSEFHSGADPTSAAVVPARSFDGPVFLPVLMNE